MRSILKNILPSLLVLLVFCSKNKSQSVSKGESVISTKVEVREFSNKDIISILPDNLKSFLNKKGILMQLNKDGERIDWKSIYRETKNLKKSFFETVKDDDSRFHYLYLMGSAFAHAFYKYAPYKYADTLLNIMEEAERYSSGLSERYIYYKLMCYIILSDIYDRKGEHEKAIEISKKILDEYPGTEKGYSFASSALGGITFAYLSLEKYDELEKFLKKIENQERGSELGLSAVWNLVKLYQRQGDIQKIKELKEHIRKFYNKFNESRNYVKYINQYLEIKEAKEK